MKRILGLFIMLGFALQDLVSVSAQEVIPKNDANTAPLPNILLSWLMTSVMAISVATIAIPKFPRLISIEWLAKECALQMPTLLPPFAPLRATAY